MTIRRRQRRPEIVVLLVFLSLSLLAHGADLPALPTTALTWDAARPIGWGDFRAVPPSDASRRTEIATIAMTISWAVRFEVTCVPGKTTWRGAILRSSLKVVNWMDPARSWAALEKRSEAVLRHEQLHFDLNEVYRRKLEIALAPLTAIGADAEAAKRVLDEIIHLTAGRILEALAVEQDLYDLETAHGASAEAQERWGKQISIWILDPLQAP